MDYKKKDQNQFFKNNFKETLDLESSCGKFTSKIAFYLSTELKPIAFCSPASFRDPESENIWHPIFLKKNKFLVYAKINFQLIKNLLIGIKNFFFLDHKNFELLEANKSNILAIGPEIICPIKNKWVDTEYVSENEIKKINWLILSKKKTTRKIFKKKIIITFYKLILAWFKSYRDMEKVKLNYISSSLVLNWILSFNWINLIIWSEAIIYSINKLKPKIVFCVHELHPLSRLVWFETTRKFIESKTVQHATISRTKLWYFPTKHEIDAGMCFPDYFYVFCKETKLLLKKNIPNTTKIDLCCGPRFSKYKKLHKIKNQEDSFILFVPSLSWWDNDIIIESIKKIISLKFQNKLVIRLHPNALINTKGRIYLNFWMKRKLLYNSHRDIRQDLEKSKLVIGATSSVLFEAAILGKKTLSIYNNKYYFENLNSDLRINISDIDLKFLNKNINSVKQDMNRIKCIKLMGLRSPVFKIN